VTDLSMDDEGVTLKSDRGDFRAQFVVDATGPFSPFAKKLQIRHTPTKLTTQSRGIFTHMVGVGSWDAMVPPKEHGMPYRMDQTTLHHIFNGGWMWVIPFNNHSQATNQLCSVGVMFDCTKYPPMDTPPEEEFDAFLARHPSIGAQFKNARSTRKWVSSPRIQYSSAQLSMGRYFALPHAAMFIDPLFSTGLNLTAHAVNLLGDILIQSFASGSLQSSRLAVLERQVLHKTEIFDRLVATSFKSFRKFDLWNAWYRVWEIGTYYNTLGAMKCILKYRETGDVTHLRRRFDQQYATPLAFSVKGYPELFESMVEAVEKVDRGEWDEARGIGALYTALERFDAMPSFITRRDPNDRTIGTFTLERLIRMFIWGKTRGPEHVRHYYDFTVGSFAAMAAQSLGKYASRFVGVSTQPLWDMFFTRTPNRPKTDPARPAAASVRKLSLIEGGSAGAMMPATNGLPMTAPVANAMA
jgi:FADH2 O2-dependent halogenase